MNEPSSTSLLSVLVRLFILALGVTMATQLVHGIHCDNFASLVAVVILLTLFNWLLKPVLVLFTLPFIIATMGIGVIFINALIFLFVGHLVQGFHVDGFLTALLGSLVVSATNFLISALMRKSRRPPPPPSGGGPGRGSAGSGGDVIDI